MNVVVLICTLFIHQMNRSLLFIPFHKTNKAGIISFPIFSNSSVFVYCRNIQQFIFREHNVIEEGSTLPSSFYDPFQKEPRIL